jgi:hypothetical protein
VPENTTSSSELTPRTVRLDIGGGYHAMVRLGFTSRGAFGAIGVEVAPDVDPPFYGLSRHRLGTVPIHHVERLIDAAVLAEQMVEDLARAAADAEVEADEQPRED